MRKLLLPLVIILFLLVLPFSFTVFAKKTTTRTQMPVVLTENKIIEGNYNAVGDTVTILGTVNGDLITAGGNIKIRGKINGDVIAAGGNVDIDGEVSQNVRVVGGNVTIAGKVARNVLGVAGTLQTIKGSSISGTLTTVAGSTDLGGYVEKATDVVTGNLSFGPSAVIKGTLTYLSNTPLEKPTTAQILGNVIHLSAPTNFQKEEKPFLFIFKSTSLANLLFELFSKFIIGLVFVLIAPRQSIAVANLIIEKPLKSLLLGFLTLILTPALIVVLTLTIIGIPMSIFLITVYLAGIYLAGIFFALFVGIKVLRILNFENPDLVLSLVTGLLVFILIKKILILGPVIAIVSTIMVFGALVLLVREVMSRLAGRI